jgi:hypothetical protein
VFFVAGLVALARVDFARGLQQRDTMS